LELVTELTNYEEFKEYDKKYEKKYGDNELTVISFDYIFIINAIFIKLKAIDLFLSNHKELIGKCNFIMWIKEFELEVDEEEEEKEDEEEEEEEDEEEEEEEEEDDEDEENEKKKKNRKKMKSHKKVKSLLSIKQNNDNDNRKMEKYKQKIEQEISKLKQKYNNENIITVEFGSDDQTFNIFRRLAIFKFYGIKKCHKS
jgi:flagellar biosynthesis GTPase FlhF